MGAYLCRPGWLDQAAADGFGDGVGAIDGTEFGEDDLEALLDRDFAPAHGEADLLVGGTLRCAAEDHLVILREIRIALGLLAGESVEFGEDAIEQFRTERFAPPGGVADGSDEIVGRRALEKVAICAG